VTLPEGTEMVMRATSVQMKVELITPVAMDKGLRFAIREGGRTVGAGTVSEISSSTGVVEWEADGPPLPAR